MIVINESLFSKNEKCIRCGGNFNLHFGYCFDCKSNNNSESIDKLDHKFRAVSYREGDLNQKHVLTAVLQSRVLGRMNFIFPINSQISYKIKVNVDNAIYEFLEDEYKLINFNDYLEMKINNEKYYVNSSLL